MTAAEWPEPVACRECGREDLLLDPDRGGLCSACIADEEDESAWEWDGDRG